MPRGGLQVAYPKELWDKVKELVIQGLAYKAISQQVGISESVIRSKAAVHKWTVAKAEYKAKGQLESLRPKLHTHLAELTRKTRVPNTSSAKSLQQVANLVLTLANATKLVEGWQDQQEQTLVNVLQISTSVTANPPKPVPEQPAIDVQAEPELKQSILPDDQAQS